VYISLLVHVFEYQQSSCIGQINIVQTGA